MMAKTKKYASFDELEVAVREYLATLDDTALNDPEAPSPLAYLELQAAGRADLAEGCMANGGYLAVSNRLGVRVQSRAPSPPTAAMPKLGELEAEPVATVSLSASAKEDKMAADLARLAARAAEPAEETTTRKSAQPTSYGDRLAPLKVKRSSSEAAAGKAASEPTDGPLYGLGRYLRLDGLQRANLALLVLLIAGGFGKTSAQVLDAGLVQTAQLGASALCVAHLLIAAYGTFLASTAGPEQQPVFWFFKLSLTGAGGLAELKGGLDKR